MAAGVNRLPELGDLPGLRDGGQVPPLRVGGLGTQRPAAEQPHRPASRALHEHAQIQGVGQGAAG